jgi:molybdopterin synthase catalytic subunit
MIRIEIVNSSIIPFASNDNQKEKGAELIFNGRVRETEHGKKIKILEYEQYEDMAKQELENIAEETQNKFKIKDIFCRHRIGKVKVGEASLHVSIWSKHRKEGLGAMTFFIIELKKRVPIWKWAILENGKKIPSECTHL